MNFFIKQSTFSLPTGHSRVGWNPSLSNRGWIPACARMTLAMIALMAIQAISPLAHAEEDKPDEKQTFFTRDTLTGNWGGLRDTLSDKGLDFEFVYTGDIFSNLSGGVEKKTVYLDYFEAGLSLDAEKVFKWKGASFYFYGIGAHGESPSQYSGDAQFVSNLDANDLFVLAEAWYQQKLFNNKFSILAGLYDTSSEFDYIDTASLFINLSHSMGPDFSQSGLNGPSFAPITSVAMRFKYEPQPWVYIQSAILDGVSGDPAHPNSTQIKFGKNDGALIVTEFGFLPGSMKENARYGKLALGNWLYTEKFDDLLDTDSAGNPERKNSFGFYVLGEYAVYRETNDLEQGLNIFGRVGYAAPAVHQFNYYVGTGAVYTGLIPKRSRDQLGLSIATAVNGKQYKRAQKTGGAPVKSAEVNIELTYRAQITPWFAIQPDIQYIINPGTSNINHALQGGVRFEVLL